MIIALVVLATIAAHRIWHYEDIFAPVRSSLGAKLLIDPTVTPLWIAAILASIALIQHPVAPLALAALATYPFLRGAVWVYQTYDPPPAGETCTPCAQKKKDMMALQQELRRWEKRIIVAGIPDIQKLAKAHPTWLFVTEGKEKQHKNIMYRPLIDKDNNVTLNNIVSVILNGGNATFVLNSVGGDPVWKFIVERIGSMKAVAWVHTGVIDSAGPQLPAHHRRVARDAGFDKVLADASPPV